MTREERLNYCKICQNQSFTFEDGVICSLTGKQATFENYCESFKKDQLKIDEQNKRREYERYDQNGDFYSTKDLPVVVPKNKQQAVLRNSRKFFGVTLLLFTGLGMYFLYLGITETELNNRWLIFVLSGLSFIGAIFYYRQYADSSDKLSFSIRGVQSNSALIQWQEIIDASIQIITREHSNSELLILNLIDGSEKKIDLTFLDNTAKNIGGIFEYFRRRAQNG